jgi:hypothetical protein
MAIKNGVLLFVEGETEVVFYGLLIKELVDRKVIKQLKEPFIMKNLKGIGGFKRVALNFFENEVLRKHSNTEFCVGLAYDTDIFRYDRQPAFNWSDIDAYFKNKGVESVIHIRQKYMIEDVFMEDYQGILRYLNLPENSNMPRGNGFEKLQILFNRANKIYYKGYLSLRFVKELDLYKIYKRREDTFRPLIKILDNK